MTALLLGMCLFWLRVAYDLQLVSFGLKMSPRTLCLLQTRLAINFWDFCSIILGVAQIVRPHPDY